MYLDNNMMVTEITDVILFTMVAECENFDIHKSIIPFIVKKKSASLCTCTSFSKVTFICFKTAIGHFQGTNNGIADILPKYIDQVFNFRFL